MEDPDNRVIREFNDRGLIWFLESFPNVRDLLGILSNEIAESLDFENAERINRSLISQDLYKHEADLIFRVPFVHGEGEVIVYLLIEHQTAPDRLMGLRFYTCMSEIWQYQKRTWQNSASPKPPLILSPIIPILLYTGEEAWNTPVTLGSLMTLPSMLEDFVPQYNILNLRLRDVSSEELTQSGSAVSWILRTLKFAKAPFEVLSHQIDLAVAALEKLSESQQEEWRRAMRFILLLIRHKREKSERTPLFEQVSEAIATHKRKEVSEMVLTDAQELMLEGEKLGLKKGLEQGLEQGIERGLEQGIERGNAHGMRALLISQLLFKFPPLSEEVQTRVMSATDEEIEAFSRKILSANSLEEMGL